MNKQTIEVLEILKGGVNNDKWGEALFKAIQALKAGEGVLPEKRELGFSWELCESEKGFNEMHDIAKPIIAKLKVRIEELERNCSKTKHNLVNKISELQIQGLELQSTKQELSQLKEKLTRENLDKIFTKECSVRWKERGFANYCGHPLPCPKHTDINEWRKETITEILKECGIEG